MSKVYIVKRIIEFQQEEVVGVCSTTSVAEILIQKVKSSFDLEDNEISRDRFFQMLSELNGSFTNLSRKMIEHFPEYSINNIDRAIDYYKEPMKIWYEEVDLYNNEQDVLNLWK